MQKGNSDGDEFKYKENIFYRSSKEMNLSTSYSLKECPLQWTHSCTYPMISYRLIENYLKYEGIEMITLIFEYVYTLSRNNHDIPEEIKKEISNCVLSAMKLLYVCIVLLLLFSENNSKIVFSLLAKTIGFKFGLCRGL